MRESVDSPLKGIFMDKESKQSTIISVDQAHNNKNYTATVRLLGGEPRHHS
jgi:hypothetical protein